MRKNTWKKIAAGAMSLTIIAGQTVLPAGLGGLFTGGTALVASAETVEYAVGSEIKLNDGVTFTARKYYYQTYNPDSSTGQVTTPTIDKKCTLTEITYDADTYWSIGKGVYKFKFTRDDDSPSSYGVSIYIKSEQFATTPIGLKIASGDGTTESPYVFEMIRDTSDISTATVNLAADNSVASITVGEDTITDLTGFDITYGTDDSHTATAVPTDAGTYYAYVTAKDTNTAYTGTAKSAAFTVINLTTLTLVDLGGAVVVGEDGVMSAVEDTYTLKGGKTYTLYTNKSVYGADTAGSIASFSGQNQTYSGTTYKYKYTLTIPATPAEGGYTLSHEHATIAHSNSTGDGVYVECSGENDSRTDVAWFDTETSYYYGSYPVKEDIKTADALGTHTEVTEFFFTRPGSTTSLNKEDLVFGESYIINATVAVTIPGKSTPDTFSIKRSVTFGARPMSENQYYLVQDGTETKLTVENGTITIPASTFTYNGKEQKPVIRVKNGGNEAVLTVSDYTDGAEGKTNAGDYSFKLTAATGEDASYSGDVTVNWSIAKANADIQIKPAENIVYDGAKLDQTDFVFEGKDAALVNNKTTYPDTTVTVTGTNITNAGDTTANVKLTFANYNDIALDIPVTINKREVKVTPAANQSTIYGTEAAPVINVTTEKAADADGDGEWDTKAGVIPADIETVDFSPTVDIAEFDYTYFVNNAGTYSYKISDAVLDNYTAILDGTAVFTVKPKKLTKEMFTPDAVDYTFDGKQHDSPEYIFSDGKFSDKKRTSKLTANDFEEGGTDHAILPGSYTLEFSGQGNYTGYVTFDWEIKPIGEYAVSLSVTSKTYDGKTIEPTSFVYKSDDSNKTAVTLPGAKTVYTYYEYDGESTVDEAYIGTLTPLDGVPKDAGKYIVVATVSAKGYFLEKVYADFTINQKEITITPNATGKTFGEADPDLAAYTYDESAVAEGDTLTFTGKYALPDYNGNAGTYPFDLGTIKVDSENYFLTISGAYVVNPQELTDANITVFKDCTVTDDGWWYPGDCVTVTGTVGGREIELVRPEYDYNTNTYINTDFAFISATKTKKTGAFSVQIEGVGNYTGFAEATVNVRNADYDHQATVEAGIGVDLADAVLKDGIKARFVLTPSLADGWTVEAYGIVYDKTGKIKDADAAKSGLVLDGDYVTKTCSATSGTAYALNITPTGNNTIWAVGYITVSNGSMSTTIYTEPKSGNVDDLKEATEADIEANVNVSLADAILKDGTKARFVLTPEIADGWTVDAYGIVYDKTGAITNADAAKSGLVLNGSYVTKTCSATDGTSYALNITPTGNTIWAVGYITVTKNGVTKTIYTEPKSGNVTDLQIEENVSVNLADAVLKDGTKARFVLTPSIADGWTVDAYGIVYDKTGAVADAEEAKSGLVLGGSYVTKTCSTTDGTSYALNITPTDDNTIWAVGYITVTKDGVTKTIYTDPKSAKVSELH